MSDEELKSEIDKMSKVIDGGPFAEPDEPEEEVNEEVKEDESKEESSEEPESKEPKEEPKEDLPKTVIELKAKLAELESTKEAKKEPPIEEPSIETQDFLKDLDIDELVRSPEELNKILNSVHKQAVTITQKAILDKLPSLVSKQVETIQPMQKVRDNFYETNPDLKDFRKVVSLVWKELSEKEPDRDMSDTLKDIASEVRKRLGLPGPGPKSKPEPKKKEEIPKLPKKGSSSGKIGSSSTKVDTVQSQISDMNKALR